MFKVFYRLGLLDMLTYQAAGLSAAGLRDFFPFRGIVLVKARDGSPGGLVNSTARQTKKKITIFKNIPFVSNYIFQKLSMKIDN